MEQKIVCKLNPNCSPCIAQYVENCLNYSIFILPIVLLIYPMFILPIVLLIYPMFILPIVLLIYPMFILSIVLLIYPMFILPIVLLIYPMFIFIGILDIFPLISMSDLVQSHSEKYWSVWHQSHYDVIDKNNNISFKCLDIHQGSPNQSKWATFLPWFQWNRPISVKNRSFSRPVSLFKSVFF